MPKQLTGALRFAFAVILSTSMAFIQSCSVGPDYVAPKPAAPENFLSELERGLDSGPADLARWWERLNDDQLVELVESGLRSNLDLRDALFRIEEARAIRGISQSDLYPTIDLNGSFSRTQTSNENAIGPLSPRTSNQFALSLDANWELDVWGGLRRALEASQGQLEASIETARGVLISVAAEIAIAYVDLRTSQERLRIAEVNVLLQEQTLELTQNQFDANLVSMLDVEQARANYRTTTSTVAPLQAEARAARNRLAVLLGELPGALETRLNTAAPIPSPPELIGTGLPLELIRRRPDVRQAERLLAAQTARIGVAEADLYPRLFISGTVGVQADDAGDLFESSASTLGVTPSVRWNLFDRQRIRNAIRVEEARTEQTLIQYERTILLALEEVENAMTAYVRNQRSRDELALGVDAARAAVELSRDQYRQGLTSFQSVIDTQSRLFQLEDALAVTNGIITRDLIGLYKALGGGWEANDIVLEEKKAQDNQ